MTAAEHEPLDRQQDDAEIKRHTDQTTFGPYRQRYVMDEQVLRVERRKCINSDSYPRILIDQDPGNRSSHFSESELTIDDEIETPAQEDADALRHTRAMRASRSLLRRDGDFMADQG